MRLNIASNYSIVFFLVLLLMEVVTSCPDGCACIYNDHVICNLGGLEKIPSQIPPETNYISLNDNPITSLNSDSFNKLTKLKFIYLEKTNITEIAPYAFRGLSDMEEITIEKNPLNHLGSYSFASLKSIRRIYLGNNKIVIIHANAFFGSDDVREISLIGNPLKVLRSNAFSGFTNVHFFYFPKGISTIEKDAFNTLKHVRMLRLENLTTTQLEQHTFRGLSNVAGMEIRGSHIGVIRKGAFEGLAYVDYLGIDHCTLEKVQKDAYKGLQNVSAFVFNSNTVESIEDHSFWGLESTSGVKHLNFTDNRIPCDCQLHYLIENLEKSAPQFQDHNYCYLPKKTIGHLVAHIEINLLEKCPIELLQVQPSVHRDHQPDHNENEHSMKPKVENVANYLSGDAASSASIAHFIQVLTITVLMCISGY